MSIGQWHDPVDICDLDYFPACYKVGASPPPPEMPTSFSRPYQAPSPGWSGILGCNCPTGSHAVAPTEHG